MANRCDIDNTDVSNFSWQQLSDKLDDCDRCVHYHYCQKVCEMNDRLKEIED